MTTAAEIYARLAAPFPTEMIQWKIGPMKKDHSKGMALPFINRKLVTDRLNDVVGPGNWQSKFEQKGDTMLCELSVRIEGEWITKSDGAGKTDYEAEKGAISDALKRAATMWGIGMYLSEFGKPGGVWVDIEPHHRGHAICNDEYPYLEDQLSRFQKYILSARKSTLGEAKTPPVEAAKPKKSIPAVAVPGAPTAERHYVPEDAPPVVDWPEFVRTLFDDCCQRADGGKQEVFAYIRTFKGFTSLTSIPTETWQKIAEHFLPPGDLVEYFPKSNRAALAAQGA